jgi:plastocyanin
VSIEAAGYNPDRLEIPVGTTVTWTNHDTAPHTVSSRDDLFNGPGMVPGETFTYTFDTPGTYTYFCQFHPEVEGTIVVTGP